MLYLLDANVLIDANRDYYPIERIPEFWEWLDDLANNQKTKTPFEMYGEVMKGRRSKAKGIDGETIERKKDELTDWLGKRKGEMVLDENVNIELINRVMICYGSDLNDEDIRKIGRDPFLIAYALQDPEKRVVVTTEVSKPSRIGANRHIPDVCKDLKVRCCNTFQFIRELNFRTDWKSTNR